jgi:hypothetical protein
MNREETATMTLRILAAARRIILGGELEYVTAVSWMLAAMASSSSSSSSSSGDGTSPLSFFRNHILSSIKVAIK